ncbi:MAG: hypothetical protein K2H85_10280 [Allobaculum sp.]|nr:hypothetical protein [Allobaculum sp.]
MDARGNKGGINAQFSIDHEQLAFPIRFEKGEIDGLIIYPNPDLEILKKLKTNESRIDLWKNLSTELEYQK